MADAESLTAVEKDEDPDIELDDIADRSEHDAKDEDNERDEQDGDTNENADESVSNGDGVQHRQSNRQLMEPNFEKCDDKLEESTSKKFETL